MPAVLADTSAIIEFFRPGGREETRQEVARLLDAGQIAVCGIVIAELLQGVREDEREPLVDFLAEAQTWELRTEDYTRAGELGNGLRRKGHKIPLSDLIIAALALRMKAQVLTLDLKDFGQIPGLKLV
ncbi:MAG TPA: PIN domain-containing protein [bacterium]|jgi:predicted nucleic acid-binding protein|nr:PIN domain-containing protein [bacterium]